MKKSLVAMSLTVLLACVLSYSQIQDQQAAPSSPFSGRCEIGAVASECSLSGRAACRCEKNDNTTLVSKRVSVHGVNHFFPSVRPKRSPHV